ncbi:MAG: hypothetical protein BWZ07_02773 [Alphaproteobacteria bacterium ADurb.BinA280]|nr:MAG: hypothetical protein BWZ07_02773 [Alphaproteobacteria bacterium ADurb.BinA280]
MQDETPGHALFRYGAFDKRSVWTVSQHVPFVRNPFRQQSTMDTNHAQQGLLAFLQSANAEHLRLLAVTRAEGIDRTSGVRTHSFWIDQVVDADRFAGQLRVALYQRSMNRTGHAHIRIDATTEACDVRL